MLGFFSRFVFQEEFIVLDFQCHFRLFQRNSFFFIENYILNASQKDFY